MLQWEKVKQLDVVGNLDPIAPEQSSRMKLNLNYQEMPILPYTQRHDLPELKPVLETQ